ncbi:12151_t:CDS:2 [Racocetra fulgida]|uniref:12151_t:CDS:1 n=1 Tax=Racocetra fulgida TaxID=60492 RepID=A0A9N8YUT9_9GLOM|nr:12151_t:CDS:2 [Racocetra fulgida]
MDSTDQSASIITNISNASVNIIPRDSSSVSQAPDISAWAATQVGGQVKLCTIHSVVDLKTENGEEFAFITYTEPEWEPVKNLRNADALIERCRQRQVQEHFKISEILYGPYQHERILKVGCSTYNAYIKPGTTRSKTKANTQSGSKSSIKCVRVQKIVIRFKNDYYNNPYKLSIDTSDPMQIDDDYALTELK